MTMARSQPRPGDGRRVLTVHGRELVFLAQVCGPGTHPGDCQPLHQQVRALRPPAEDGSLNPGQTLLDTAEAGTSRVITDAVTSADGSTLTFVIVNVPAKPQPSTVTVSQTPMGSHAQRVIYQTRGSTGLEPDVFLSADASGRQFLITAGPAANPANGWIHDGKLIKEKPPGAQVFYEARQLDQASPNARGRTAQHRELSAVSSG